MFSIFAATFLTATGQNRAESPLVEPRRLRPRRPLSIFAVTDRR